MLILPPKKETKEEYCRISGQEKLIFGRDSDDCQSLDFDRVTVVGVINADIQLYLPIFVPESELSSF